MLRTAGPYIAAGILAAWAEQKAREIMVFLHSHGVGTARAVRIFKTYSPNAVQVMSEHPYRDFRGIEFKTAGAIQLRSVVRTALELELQQGAVIANKISAKRSAYF